VILDVDVFIIAIIRHAVECMPRLPEKISINSPNVKAYISKNHVGILFGIIIIIIIYKYGLI
jgi:hypothetical protein